MRRLNRPSPSAFTLVELLITIGIIGVLIGLLFPVISKLKKSAYAASTAQTINTLQGSIQQYFSVFQTYPSMYDWAQPYNKRYLVAGAPVNYPTGVLPANPTTPATEPFITQAESLFLSLTGGIKITVNATYAITAYDYDPTRSGSGPSSLNPRIPRQYQAFAPADGKLSIGDMDLYTGGIDDGDTNVPEFVDSFPDPRPILYARAHRGAATTMTQYPPTDFGYGFSTAVTAGEFANANTYYGDPSFTGGTTPRQKDQYILISAGVDGKFGTKDDITNFGAPGR